MEVKKLFVESELELFGHERPPLSVQRCVPFGFRHSP